MEPQNPNLKALETVDEKRRGFLTRLLTTGAAAAALPTMSTIALGAEPQEGPGRGQAGGAGKGGDAGKGKGGFEGKGGMMDPEIMAARMIEQFDKDGDKALNKKELAAALKMMMERRGGGMAGKGGFQGKGGAQGKGKGGFGGN